MFLLVTAAVDIVCAVVVGGHSGLLSHTSLVPSRARAIAHHGPGKVTPLAFI